MEIGINNKKMFLQYTKKSVFEKHFATISEKYESGIVIFYFQNHYTEIEKKHLILFELAYKYINQFFKNIEVDLSKNWCEI